MARKRNRSQRAALDVEEIAPDRFLLYNFRARGIVKGEGQIDGRLFTLTSWRREGLLARLRQHGFSVGTLEDRVAALPQPGAAPPIEAARWWPLSGATDRLSFFDPRAFRWAPLDMEERDGRPGVALRPGWVVRRRKGRGPASYALVAPSRESVYLEPLDETNAILLGYAQAIAWDDRPLLAEWRGEQLLLPDVELPPPHRALLQRIATAGAEGLLVDRRAWPLAQEVFRRLGVGLNAPREREP